VLEYQHLVCNISVTDKLIPEDGEEAKQERTAVSSEQCLETIYKAAEGKLLSLKPYSR